MNMYYPKWDTSFAKQTWTYNYLLLWTAIPGFHQPAWNFSMSSLHPSIGQESKRQRKTIEGIPLSTQVSTGESYLPRSSPGSGMVQPFQVPRSGWLQGGRVPFTCKFLWKWNLPKEFQNKLHGKLLSQLWPTLSAPLFSSLNQGWATKKGCKISRL